MTDAGTYHCANCGAELPRRLARARMITCTHCGTSAVLRDEVFELAGEGGVMQDAPSLIHLGRNVSVGGTDLLPVGHARFSYGRGWWDEYWCLDGKGEGHWVSSDEGDYAVEQPLDPKDWPRDFRPALGAGTRILGESFTVSEAETATCIALRGEFPEEIEVGESHLYFDLSGPGSRLATCEKWEGGQAWTLGRWLDAWDVFEP